MGKTKTRTLVLTLLVSVMLLTGCTKKVQITVMNHSNVSHTLQLTVPDETMTLGSVGPGGRLSSTLAVKTDDLPAQCRLSAEGGAAQSFVVTEDSPSKWWFHITGEGQLAGPYGKNDVHVETVEDANIVVPGGMRMVPR